MHKREISEETNSLFKELKNDIKNVVKKVETYTNVMAQNTKKDKVVGADVLIKLEEIETPVTEKRQFKDDETVVSSKKLCEQNNLCLPLQTKEEFLAFESDLRNTEKSASTDLVSVFTIFYYIFSTNIKKIIAQLFFYRKTTFYLP